MKIPSEIKSLTTDPNSNLEDGPKTPFKDVSEIDPIKNSLQINDRMTENFADQTLIDDGNDELFASLDLAVEQKSEKSSKHFSNILPMTSTFSKASLNMHQPDHEMIFGHNSYNQQSILDELVYVPETTHKIRKSLWKKLPMNEKSVFIYISQ